MRVLSTDVHIRPTLRPRRPPAQGRRKSNAMPPLRLALATSAAEGSELRDECGRHGGAKITTRKRSSRVAFCDRATSPKVPARCDPEMSMVIGCAGLPRRAFQGAHPNATLLASNHSAAFFRATATCPRTGLAMVELVPCALRSARLADVGAYLTDLGRECTPSSHVTGREATNSCAIHVQTYALRHHPHVAFLQAGRCTMVTGVSTCVARVDTGTVLLVGQLDTSLITEKDRLSNFHGGLAAWRPGGLAAWRPWRWRLAVRGLQAKQTCGLRLHRATERSSKIIKAPASRRRAPKTKSECA